MAYYLQSYAIQPTLKIPTLTKSSGMVVQTKGGQVSHF